MSRDLPRLGCQVSGRAQAACSAARAAMASSDAPSDASSDAAPVSIDLLVTTMAGDTMTVTARPGDTVETLKGRIRDAGVLESATADRRTEAIELIHDNALLDGSDGKTLEGHGLGDHAQVFVVVGAAGDPFEITVRTVLGEEVAVEVDPLETVDGLIGRLSATHGLDPRAASLIWQAKRLDRTARLCDCDGIVAGSLVYMVAVLLGD